jgi:ubiquinone/menaquinone biosynthesis C-methylase UbiE
VEEPTFKKRKNKSSSEKYFRRYLKISPLSVALVRSVEAKNFASVKMTHPILDIGCGFGEFAKVFVDDPIDMGVDNAPFDLYAASKVKKYNSLLLADARHLPFANESYATVMSVSTFEHITDVSKVLKEAYRVLRPNGILIASMETDEVDKNTFYRPILIKIGLTSLSNYFGRSFNNLFHRHMLLSKTEWKQMLTKTGFEIVESREIVSPTIIKLFEIFMLTAWPAQLFRSILGRRVVYRPEFASDLLTKIFLKYVDDEKSTGTVLFIVARKPRFKKT